MDEELTNTENLNIDNVNTDDNVATSENSSQSTETTAKTTVPAVPSKSQLKVPETPAPKKKKIAQVAALVKEIKSITNDLNRDHTRTPQQDEHDIFGAFVASQLKMLSFIQAITGRDEINAILSRCRKADLNCSSTPLSYQTPSQESSDTTVSIVYDSNLTNIYHQQDSTNAFDVASTTTDYQQQDSTNDFDVIATAFKNV